MFAPPPGGAFLKMKFPPLIEAIFLERLNRFVGRVLVGGKEQRAYIRNTGRLKELLFEGSKVYLKEKQRGLYKYEVLLVELKNTLVCIDSHIANRIYAEYLGEGVVFEPSFGKHRFDLLYGNRVIEVKSVNLVKDGIALFPDAPTERGTRHLRFLMELGDGYVPEVVFVVQREDARAFSPHWEMDEEFSTALKEFALHGYAVKSYLCSVSLEGINLKGEIPVLLEGLP